MGGLIAAPMGDNKMKITNENMSNWVNLVESQNISESVTYTLKAIVACKKYGVCEEDEDVYWEDLAIILSHIAKKDQDHDC